MLDNLKKYLPLNFDLMANPINWIVILVMVLIAVLAISLVFNSSNTMENADG